MDNSGNSTLAKIQSILLNKINLLIVALIFIIAAAGFIIMVSSPNKSTSINTIPTPVPSQKPLQALTQNKIIAKVREENIYQKDLDYEISYYPQKSAQVEKILKDKMINDSIILQSGYKLINLSSLDRSIFNSPDKNYQKRIKTVSEIKEKVNGMSMGDRKGVLISVWFKNVYSISLSYEEAKKIAYQKISGLYEKVKNGTMTIEQAGENIKQDTSLKNIDPAYKANAIMEFTAIKNKSITFDPDFDALVWKLKEGELTEIYPARDNTPKEEVTYFFAQVKHMNKGEIISFDDWLKTEKTKYETVIY